MVQAAVTELFYGAKPQERLLLLLLLLPLASSTMINSFSSCDYKSNQA